jgi:type VI secretion system protein ImpA
MSSSIETLILPVSEDTPSGENLEYDPEYLEMENFFQAESESSIEVEGQEISGPDWKSVEKRASSLLKRTRDLHVQVYAVIASIHMGGLLDFRDNLKILTVYLRDFWDTVHPQLDPDDDNDPMLRLNTLQMLNEHSLITHALDRVKLVELKGMGQFGVREVELSQGKESPVAGEEVTDLNVIREAFKQAGGEYVDSLVAAAEESIQLFSELDTIWQDKAGDPEGLRFDVAVAALKKASVILHELAPAGSETAASEMEAEGGDGAAAASSATVTSRADVIRLLDNICEYYSVQEPSSPIPLLLRRAQRLVEKSFMEILQDIVPDSVNQARIVSGNTDQ